MINLLQSLLDTFHHHYMKLHIRYLYWLSERQDREFQKLMAECDRYEAEMHKQEWGSP